MKDLLRFLSCSAGVFFFIIIVCMIVQSIIGEKIYLESVSLILVLIGSLTAGYYLTKD